MLVALFRRNRVEETTTLPDTDLYNTPPRERSWMAWLLALVTLVVTVAVVLGLFYGGRFIYRKFNKSDTNQTPATPLVEEESNTTDSDETSSSSSNTNTNEDTTTNSNTSSSSTNAVVQTGNVPSQNTAGKGDLPNTGPGDTLAVFVVVSLAGYLLHRRFAVKSN